MSRWKSLILLLAGIGIIALIIHLAGMESVFHLLIEADFRFVAAAVACQITALILWSWRWKILLQPFHVAPLRRCLTGILIGIFFNNITPIAKAGGEPFRAYYLGEREGVRFEDTFATVAMDRIMESLPFLVIFIVSVVYFLLHFETSSEMMVIVLVALFLNMLLLVGVLYFSYNLGAAKRLVFSFFGLVGRFTNRVEKYESAVEEAVEQYHEAIKMLVSHRRNLIDSLCISSVFWLLLITRNYLVVLALGYQIEFSIIVIVQTVGTFVGIVPVLPGGLGSTDGIIIFLYLSFGFPTAAAVSASLLDRFISYWMVTTLGALVVAIERTLLKGQDSPPQ
ncbi:MAG: flippase-like domain-containing protein [Theionarchaea archaeon]|nr:flippase-like domain-containing protein [Theionarchaea archaeon]MBU7001867.1 flippase-like domain-containing protein [Theionarchaea archaeon]MBU7022306.1 flippase-like domain-containing protein [Theionarchaea archaeon]MBU7035061.1 flippase-like domain-containing protein [Theionarchaea archaeon]MBU7040663.1 flippase-like domain-containing protein [Theionarchaea archaeon]